MKKFSVEKGTLPLRWVLSLFPQFYSICTEKWIQVELWMTKSINSRLKLFGLIFNRFSWNDNQNCKVTGLMTCLLLYWPKIHRIFVNFSFFWHWVSLFLFSSIKIINGTYDKKRKKERRQTFRAHVEAPFSAINFKINSKFS